MTLDTPMYALGTCQDRFWILEKQQIIKSLVSQTILNLYRKTNNKFYQSIHSAGDKYT